MKIGSKTALAVALSKLMGFKAQKVRDEQYTTDSEVAASMLWQAYMKGDVSGKVIADLGAGTGILGLGALLLGAKKVFFVESDKEALEITQDNHNSLKSEASFYGKSVFFNTDIKDFNEKADVVIE